MNWKAAAALPRTPGIRCRMSHGWRPSLPVEQNVREYVAWMRQQQTTEEFLKEADGIMRQQGVVRTTRQRTKGLRAKGPRTTGLWSVGKMLKS